MFPVLSNKMKDETSVIFGRIYTFRAELQTAEMNGSDLFKRWMKSVIDPFESCFTRRRD
jgi:hypothetical protein